MNEMSKTVTVTKFKQFDEFTTKAGRPSIRHVIGYKEDAEEKTAYLFESNPLYTTLSTKTLTVGKQYDFGFAKNDRGMWELAKIGAAGSMPKSTYTKKSYGGGGGSSPDKDLSMELSGLMQAIISKVGLDNLKENTTTAYIIKQQLVNQVKSGTFKTIIKEDWAHSPLKKGDTVTGTVGHEMHPVPKAHEQEEYLHEERTQSVISFSADDIDNDPF